MPRLTNPAEIRILLLTDPAWSLYALGDLAPGFFEHTTWHGTDDGAPALLLLLRLLSMPVLFALGEPEAIRPLLAEIGDDPRLFANVRPEVMPLLGERYDLTDPRLLWRMILEPVAFSAPASSRAERLSLSDLDALTGLYRQPDAPDFFHHYMVEQGIFYGIREAGELVAVAGTHLIAAEQGVAAIGNVYTHPEHRGHGYATAVTAAITHDLLELGIPAIGLNVEQTNSAALHIYERLGFRRRCEFYEAVAQRQPDALL